MKQMKGIVYWRCGQVNQILPCIHMSTIHLSVSLCYWATSDRCGVVFAGTGGEEASLFAMDIFRMSVILLCS
jgi:hypothetical protein